MPTRLAAAAMLLLVLGCAASGDAAAGPVKKPASDTMVIPDLDRFAGTWLWVESSGIVATSTPETKGVARTLVLNPDLTYAYHERRDTRDTTLCEGRFYFSEQSAAGGTPTDYLDFEGWFEPYEHRMVADFDGPDTLFLAGAACDNCPDHTFVRGRIASFSGSVKKGERFRRDLWGGLRFELEPDEFGWEIVVRDAARPEEDLARLTPPLHGPNPTDIQGWNFRNKANTGPNLGDVNTPQRARDFIFSREVGKSIRGESGDSETYGAEVERVEKSGRGILTIDDLTLDPPASGGQAGIASMRFTVAIEEVRGRAQETKDARQ